MKDYTINVAKWLTTQMHPGIPVHFRAPMGTGAPTVVVEAAKSKGKTLFIGGVIEGQSFKKQVADEDLTIINCTTFIDYTNDFLHKYESFIIGKGVHARHRVAILATLQAARKYIISL